MFFRSIIFLVCVSGPLSALAQQDVPQVDLRTANARAATVERLTQRAERQKNEARAEATKRGWPVRFKKQDGRGVVELLRLEDGKPMYQATANVNAAISTGVDRVRNTNPFGLNGAGWTVGVWDGGVARTTHQEFGGRVAALDGGAINDHATHVSGTISAMGVNVSALGMAPSVSVDSYYWDNDEAEMASRGATVAGEAGKLTLSNHSYELITGWTFGDFSGNTGWHWFGTWGEAEADGFGAYESGTRLWDEIGYDAPYYLIFKAAGNNRGEGPPSEGTNFYYWDGGWQSKAYAAATDPSTDGNPDGSGYDTIPHRGNGKNLMTVGAVTDALAGVFRDVGQGSMSSFSGWGPTDDGRVKPDIVANGIGVNSPLAVSDTAYASWNGTSMATPSASGAAVLLAEYYFEETGGAYMRASTLKGLIVCTADDAGNPGPDYSFGHGLMNTKAAADLIAKDVATPGNHHIEEASLSTGNSSDVYTVYSDGTKALEVTLCWTDPPATALTGLDPTAPRLVNDLDIRITPPGGGTVEPFVLDPSNPANHATTGDNFRDNVERIRIASPAPGNYTITVNHKGSLVDDTGGAAPQLYSLIVYGNDTEDDLAVTPDAEFQSTGRTGGTASPPATTYTLRNNGSASLDWTAATTASWLDLDVSSGSLGPGATTDVVATINPSAATLPGGDYTESVSFTNTATLVTREKSARLNISKKAVMPFTEDFESGGLDSFWEVSGTGPIDTQVRTEGAPHGGSYHAVMASAAANVLARNELTLHLDLAGWQNVSLSFWARDYADENDGPPSTPFFGGANFDGVAISEDGTTWYEVQGLRSELSSTYAQFTVDLDAAIATHGLSFSSDFQIRFNQYDNFFFRGDGTGDGIGIDDVSLTGTAPTVSAPDLTSASDSGNSNSDDVTNQQMPAFSGTATPGSTVTLHSDLDGTAGIGTADGGGNWTITPSVALSEGNHQITASVGGPESAALPVTIDITAPDPPTILDLTTDTGSSATDDITNDDTPTFQGLAMAGSTVELFADGVLQGSASGDGATPWSVTVPGGSPLSDDDYSVTATATDLAGNTSGASSSLGITIDTTAPTLSFGKAAGQLDPAPSGPVEFTATFNEDVTGFTGGDVTTGGTSAGAVAVGAGPDVYSVSISASNTEGTITASVGTGVANDTAGNASAAPTLGDTSITLDSHGSDGGSATALTFSNDSTSDAGWIDPSDTDGFSFTLTEPRIVTIQTTGSTDTRGALFPLAGGGALHDPEQDKNAGTGNNFLISEALPPGNYVVYVTSEGTAQTGDYSIAIDSAPIPMLINEVDADTGANDLEFVELFDGGAGSTSLDGMVLVFYRGDTEESYLAIDLDGESTDPDGYFVVGNTGVSNVDLVLPNDSLRNDRSAAALYFGDDSDFPNGTALQTSDLLDALVSLPDGGSKTAQLDDLLLSTQPHLDESANGFRSGQSLQRIPDGSGGSRVTEDYVVAAPTPGQANGLPPAPSVPDLESGSDSGSFDNDDITNVVRPTFSGFARPGSLVRLSSDQVGSLGVAQTGANGVYTLTSGVDLLGGTHVITPTTVSSNVNGPSLTIEIDITAPDRPTGLDLESTSDSGNSDSDEITNDTTPTFSGDAETGSSVTLFANSVSVGTGTANSPWSITSSVLADDSYSITATCTDVAGNESPLSDSLSVVIDTTSPSVAIALGATQTSPALSGPARFTATFSEDVVGFETEDVMVSGTAAGAAMVSGSQDQYSITVETTRVEGSIIIGISALVAEDLAGNPNLAASAVNNIVYLDRDDSPDGEPADVTPGSGPFFSYLSPDDVDTFTFVISALSYVTVQTVGPLDTLGEIRNASDTLLNDPETDDDLGEDENFLSFLTLGAGTYTAVVSAKDSQEGDFELTVDARRVPPPPVINNNLVLKSKLLRKIKKLKKKAKKVKKKGNTSKAKKLKKKIKKLKKQLKAL